MPEPLRNDLRVEELPGNRLDVLVAPHARKRVREVLRSLAARVVVLDDDPTGSQCVQGIPVITSWAREDLEWAFLNSDTAFFVLTNTRSLGAQDAHVLLTELVIEARAVAKTLGIVCVFVSRGDSTLRGHFPLETDALQDIATLAGEPYDALVVAPAYIGAGRVTAGDVHYVIEGGRCLPVGSTSYAADASFGFVSSDLRDYVEEKTEGRVAAAEVIGIGLDDIRSGGPERVRDIVAACSNGMPVIVNAVDDADLDVVALGVALAWQQGSRVLFRTGPSLVPALAGLDEREPLTRTEIFSGQAVRDGAHGLVVVGSHVPLTTAQLGQVLELDGVGVVELDVDRLLDPTTRDTALKNAGSAVIESIKDRDTVLVSSRRLVSGSSPEASLEIARQVSAALVTVTAETVDDAAVAWVVAKGGITSSDVATKGLGFRRGIVLGQIFPGMISVWVKQRDESGRLIGLPYIVFAGNVGKESTLAEVVELMRAG